MNMDLNQLSKTTKFICNAFWKEIFKTLPEIMNCCIAKWKLMIPYVNIWGSPVIKNTDGAPLDQSLFSVEARNVQYIADLLKQSQSSDGAKKIVDELMT